MVIKTTDVIIIIPQKPVPVMAASIVSGSTTYDVKAYVNDAAVTKRTFMLGIGDFDILITNEGDMWTDKFVPGDTIYIYGDYESGSTMQFKGRIDYPKKKFDANGSFIEITGRHISYIASEDFVTYSATDTGTNIMKYLASRIPGATSNNVSTEFTEEITVNWEDKPWLECARDVCTALGADGYFDDDLDCHLFKSNSIMQLVDCVDEGYNMLSVSEFGTDDFNTKDTILARGKKIEGIPLLYKKGSGNREKIISDESIDSANELINKATKEYDNAQDVPPQGKASSFGMPNTKPGDNVFVFSERQKICAFYKVVELTHKFGPKQKGWFTECKFEKEERGLVEVLRESKRKELALTSVNNPNNMEYSYIITFADMSSVESNLNCTISTDGYLVLSGSNTDGSITSIASYAIDSNITQAELRIVGEQLGSSTFYCEISGSRTTLESNEATNVSGAGKQLKIVANILKDTTNTNPRLKAVGILFK